MMMMITSECILTTNSSWLGRILLLRLNTASSSSLGTARVGGLSRTLK